MPLLSCIVGIKIRHWLTEAGRENGSRDPAHDDTFSPLNRSRCSARLWSFAITKLMRPTRRQTERASRYDSNLFTTNSVVSQASLFKSFLLHVLARGTSNSIDSELISDQERWK